MSKKIGWGIIASVSAAALASAAAWYASKKMKEERQECIEDEFLLNSFCEDQGPEVVYVIEDSALVLSEDSREWKSLQDGEEVDISFQLEGVEEAKAFQDDLAREGYSSRLDGKENRVSVILIGPMTEEEVTEFSLFLEKCMKDYNVLYEGFTFNE